MYGISKLIPGQLRICAKYNNLTPSLYEYSNKILTHSKCIKDTKKSRNYSTQLINKYKVEYSNVNQSRIWQRNYSSSIDASQTQTKRKSRKWKYMLGLGGILGVAFFYYTSEDDDDELKSMGLPAPSIPSDITKDWIEDMLTEYENRDSKNTKVIVKSFEMDNAIKPGEGFNSQLVKLDVHASVQNLQESVTTSLDKEYHVMIKMCDQSKAMTREMNRFIASDLKELTAYSWVIPELNKFQEDFGNEFRINVPGFIYGKYTNKESVLVIENMKPAGYIPYSIKSETDLKRAKSVVENLAKLHAVSYSFNETHKYLDKFPCYNGEGLMNWFNSFMNSDSILDNAIKLLELQQDKDLLNLSVKIQDSKSKLERKLKDVVRDDDSKKLMCFTHGDVHSSNLLFKYGEDEDGNQEIIEMQFVDWQMANWNSPVMDLQYYLTICTTHEFRKAHLETLLNHYHSIFTQATTKMGTPASHWTYEEFKEEYKRFAVYGLLRGLMVIMFTQSQFSEFYQRDMLKEPTHGNPRIERMNSKICKYIWHKTYTSPTFEKFQMQLAGLMFYFIRKEIIAGKNPHFNERILGLILDAEEQGLFDDASSK